MTYAKANPGKVTWGSQGFGTSPHLLAEMFKLETGLNIVHVPYRGTAPVLAAMLAGEVQMIADASTTSLPHIQAGKLRPIAVAMASAPKLPDVPTTAEAGFRSCSPLLARRRGAGRHAARHRRQAQRRVPRQPRPAETRARLANLGAEIKIGTPAEFAICSRTSLRGGPP